LIKNKVPPFLLKRKEEQMKLYINLTIKLDIARGEVKINNLLYQLKGFMAQIYFGILKAIFSAVEERMITELKESHNGRYVKNGHPSTPRQINTPYGLFKYRMIRISDKETGKTFMPLPEAIDLSPYCRQPKVVGEGGIGIVCHLSYRNSSKEVKRILGTEISKSTLHRQVQEFGSKMCNWKSLKEIPYRFLMVDGTKVRMQETDEKGRAKKVEMRWALASTGEKERFKPVGIWIDKSWKDIYRDLKNRLNYSKLEVLFSDGGPGIEGNLLSCGMRHQRCRLHGRRDFPYILYMEGLKKRKQKIFKEKLNSIPAMSIKRRELEQLRPEDVLEVKRLAEKTREGFRELLEALPKDKYPKARVYIESLSRGITTFFDFWLENKKWIHLNTNAIENRFSLVKNRIWAIGKRWSEQGLMNWLMVVIRKLFLPESWDELWARYLGINSNLNFELVKVSYDWI